MSGPSVNLNCFDRPSRMIITEPAIESNAESAQTFGPACSARAQKRRDGPVGITIRIGRHRVHATDLQFRAIGRDRPSPRHHATLKKDRIFGDVNGEARMAMLTLTCSPEL